MNGFAPALGRVSAILNGVMAVPSELGARRACGC